MLVLTRLWTGIGPRQGRDQTYKKAKPRRKQSSGQNEYPKSGTNRSDDTPLRVYQEK